MDICCITLREHALQTGLRVETEKVKHADLQPALGSFISVYKSEARAHSNHLEVGS